MNFNDRVYDIVRRVPKGKVISLGRWPFWQPQRRPAVGWAVAPQSIRRG